MLAVTAIPATALPVFSQTPDLETLRASDYDWFDDSGFVTADNFSLSSAEVVRSINWFGGYGVGTDLPELVDDFIIAFFDANGGQPAENPFATRYIGATAERVDTGETYDNFITPFPNYAYSANIEGVSLLGGTDYYISIINNTQGYEQDWLWGSSLYQTGLGDGGWTCRRTVTPSCSQWQSRGTDQAFTLNSHVLVSAPATLGLFALALAAFGWTRCRNLWG